MGGSRARNLALLGLLAWTAAAALAAGQVINLEQKKKAAYLIYFGSGYVRWPDEPFPGANKQFVIGILGRDRFGNELRAYEGRALSDGRKIVVHRFGTMQEYRPCHILYISAEPAPGRAGETPQQRLEQALKIVGPRPVLVVSESPGLAVKGAAINFEPDPATRLLEMEINRDAERQARLTISARMLNLNTVRIVP